MQSFSSVNIAADVCAQLEPVFNQQPSQPGRIDASGALSSAELAEFVRIAVRRLLEQPFDVDLTTILAGSLDYDSLRRFLAPTGNFFRVLYRLDREPNAAPFEIVLPLSEPHIVGASEYFLVRFAEHLKLAKSRQTFGFCDSVGDSVYAALVQDYACFFLPLDGAAAFTTVADVVLQARTNYDSVSGANSSGDGRWGYQQQYQKRVGGSNESSFFDSPPSNQSLFSPLRLLRRDVFRFSNLHSSHSGTSSSGAGSPAYFRHSVTSCTYDSNNSEVLMKSWAFVRLLVESWLPFAPVNQHPPLPSEIQLHMVRYLLKHLHHFCHSPVPAGGNTALVEFKQTVLSALVQQPLFLSLRGLFDRWPLDTSFRTVMETWLTYIQPWRYVSQEITDLLADGRWASFIEDNLRFYTVLTLVVIERFLRMDFESTRETVLPWRLSRVFVQPDLMTILRRVSPDQFGRSTSKLLLKLAELLYKVKLCSACQRTLLDRYRNKLELKASLSRSGGGGPWRWLQETFSGEPPVDVLQTEQERCIEHLNAICQNCADAFALSIPVVSRAEVVTRLRYHPVTMRGDAARTFGDDDGQPDSFVDERTGFSKLTPLGRAQVRDHTRRFCFDASPTAVPTALRSINSGCESAVLVRMLYHVAEWINATSWMQQLKRAYSQQPHSCRGRFARRMLFPPSPRLPNPHGCPAVVRKVAAVEPGISLRSFASYRRLVVLTLIVILMKFLFNFHPLSSLILLLLVYCSVQFLLSLFDS